MVFSGQPSTACHACRERRAKCDRLQNGCTQCRRKKMPCPGYRNPGELRLRDETSRVALKVQRHKGSPAPVKASSSPESSPGLRRSNSSASTEEADSPLPIGRLSDVTDDLALAYFMSAYIVSSPFEAYLSELYTTNTKLDDALSSAIHAASFAAFSQRIRDPHCLEASRRRYALALTRTNASLACPQSAVLDKTLAAVLLLGLFETIVFQGRESPENWTAHTLGAVGLLRLRGPQQLKSRVSRMLFAQTANNIRTSCVQRSVAVPAEFVALNEEAMSYLDPQDPAVRLGPVIERTASIRAREKGGDASLLHDTLELDRDIANMAAAFQEELRRRSQPREDTPPWVYVNAASSHPNRRTAKVWNSIRMMRIFLNEVIWDIASGVVDRTTNQTYQGPDGDPCQAYDSDYWIGLEELAANNMTELAKGVLSSVADFMEPAALGGRFAPSARSLVWPLTLLYRSHICPPAAANYALEILDRLGKDLNLPEAASTARWAHEEMAKEDWLHLYHLG